MKKTITLLLLACVLMVQAQKPVYTDALSLTMIGKLGETTQPYHRVDTAVYRNLTEVEARLLRGSSGMAVCFKTNSSRITTQTHYSYRASHTNTTLIAVAGFDLYIKQDGEWLYAASAVQKQDGKELTLIKNMDNSEKECLLYLPLLSEISSLQIGIDKGSYIKPMENPFRHRIVVFGSSFTHGVSVSRPGMSWPMQLERSTDLHFINLGMSGNSKLQPEMAQVLADAEADAFVFDAFSNPKAEEIRKRFPVFLATLRKTHPTTPLIFLQTLDREKSNFDLVNRASEAAKKQAAEEVVHEAMKWDKHIYFIDPKEKTGKDHITSTDGTHPSDLGYWRWAQQIEPKLMKILKKYGIK